MSFEKLNHKLIRVTSSDRIPDDLSNNGSFTVELKENSLTQGVRSVVIKEVQCPNTFYNIRSSNGFVNNVLTMQENGQPDINVVVPEGQYSLSTFITALDIAINALLVGGTVATTQDPLTLKLIFTFTGTTAIIYDFDDGNVMASVLGITATTPSAQAVINADSLPNLSGISMIYFHSQEISQGNLIDGDSGIISVMESLSFHDVPFGATGYRQNDDDLMSSIDYPSVRNLSRINIRVRDQYGNRLIPAGDVIITFKFFY